MREVKKILYTYSRPSPFVGLKGKENAKISTRSYYQAKRELFPSLDVCFINRFEDICNEEIEKRKRFPPSGRELVRKISLPAGMEIKFFVQPQVRCSYESVLNSLEETLTDLMNDALDGYFPEYIKIYSGEPYIALDVLLFRIAKRKIEKYSREEISKIIKIEPEDKLFSDTNNKKKKRLILPYEFTTEGKEKINLEFLDDETFRKAIENEDYNEELQLSGIEYLRATEFKGSVELATCIPFEEEVKRVSKERKTSWIEIEDLLFYVPRIIREVTKYGEIYKKLFSTDKKSPGEFYILMMDEKEYEDIKKGFEDRIKKRAGSIYIPIEVVINKIKEYRESDEFKTRVEQYREIIPTMIF
ncbi:MAG: hypothetical protein QXJ96_01575 [Candidatus Aenigmatarchaeota archaeon]|nr:hypothetical protein [Candidatus Aenigmarchaeota archaeon]